VYCCLSDGNGSADGFTHNASILLAADDVKRLIMNDSFYLDTLFTYLTHPALVRLK
jgi:hypothetical protein